MGTGAITGLGSVLGSNVGTAAGSLIGRYAPDALGVNRMSEKPDPFGLNGAANNLVDAGAGLGGGAVVAIGGAGAGAYGGYQLAQALFGDEDGKNPREEKEEDKIASFQKEALGIPTLAGLSLGGIINLLRDRSISRGMLTGGLTGAGVDLGSGLGSAVGAEISGDPLSNTAAFGLASGGLGGGVGGYTLAQKLHDAISEDKDEDEMDNMLSQYKKVASMYPTLTKQAFEMPEGISDAWSGLKDYFSNNPDAMNALIGGGAGAIGGGLLGYLKSDKNESSAGDIFGHALLGAGAGAGAGYGANRLGEMVANSDWYKNMRDSIIDKNLEGFAKDAPGRLWDWGKNSLGFDGPNATENKPTINPAATAHFSCWWCRWCRW